MGMRVEKDTRGNDVVISYDKDGKFEWGVRDYEFLDRPLYMITDDTVAKLEVIVNKQDATLYPKTKGGRSNDIPLNMNHLVAHINECMIFFESDFVYMNSVENQTALRALLKAFNELGEEGGATVLHHYLENAGVKRTHRKPGGYLSPRDFSEAVGGLIHGKKSGGGRRSRYADKTRKMLFDVGYRLFLELELEPTIAEGGDFGTFMRTILNDPALKDLGRPPDNLKALIQQAEKDIKAGSK